VRSLTTRLTDQGDGTGFISLYATSTMSYVCGFRRNFLTRCFDLRQVRLIEPNFTHFLKVYRTGIRLDQQVGSWLQQGHHQEEFDASGGELGLQDGRRRLVEVVGWLRWKLVHPLTVGPGKAEQTKRRGPLGRSASWAAPACPWRLPCAPVGGPMGAE
jgi:hypothetical protein